MNRLFFCVLLLLAAFSCPAQYYYNDILAAAQSDKQYQVLKANHIQTVNARSFENDNKPAEGFRLNQEISKDASKIITRTDYPSAGHTYTVSYYANNRIAKTEDSSANVFTVTSFEYDAAGNISRITSLTDDPARSSRSEEVHAWTYRDNGQPSGMLRIKDRKDTLVVEFVTDEKGNIGEERWKKNGRRTETYYYYYNDNHQLTDIVRYNVKAKRLLPDYLFEYDEKGRISQMTQVPLGSSNYMVWKYVFNSKGLKQRELCYNKQKQLVGRIEYTYQQRFD
jgi:YD repeat-containing protein